MFAVIKTGSKQYKVKEGQKLKIEKLEAEEGSSVDFDNILLVADENGDSVQIGAPTVSGAKVSAKILLQGRAKKVDVIKYKSKIRYRKKTGHRQQYTEVLIENIAV